MISGRAPSSFARRPLAAVWFAAFGALSTFLFFLRLAMAPHAIVLYIAMPSLAAGISGYIWGGAILDSSKTRTYGQSVLRGFLVGAGTFAIFAVLYSFGVTLLEGEWSLIRVRGIFLFTLTFGILMGGPLAAVTGVTASVTLFRLGRAFVGESNHS